MRCPKCGSEMAGRVTECPKCHLALVRTDAETRETHPSAWQDDATQTLPAASRPAPSIGESHWSDPRVHPNADASQYASLRAGAMWGSRYEVLRSLGQGGMGAVYQVRDCEVDRFVALKVIRPELAGDPAILRRFRQELILARQVTHPNVVRIFDLGINNGLRFISMEFIDGKQLSSICEEKGKLKPREAAEIMVQVCRGLDAVHTEGVVHRDLKPANIMIASDGRVVLMDFGIARAGDHPTESGGAAVTSAAGITQVGTLLGTPRYMSPEQALGEAADARSDLFAAGIIFYELLTGDTPFAARSLAESLRKRCQETAPAPNTREPEVPKALNDIVLRCLRTKKEERYQSAGEVVRDLEIFLGIARPVRRWKWPAAGLAAAVAAGTLLIGIRHGGQPAPALAPLKILIADLDNQTADPVFNASLEPMLSIAMEGASFITTYDRADAHKLAAQLQPRASRLDASMARLVAIREGINVVISGGIAFQRGKYRLSVDAVDGSKGTVIKRSEVAAASKDEVLRSVGKVAAELRTALGDATTESAKLAAAETFSTASLDAAQKYAQAQDLQQKGKWEEAVRVFGETVKADPDFGRAYAGMASTLYNMGRRQEAQKYYEIALSKLNRMSDREKYRTRGGYFLLMRKDQEAVEQFKTLVNAYPADSAGIADLAFAYFNERDMAAALREGRRAIEIYPNNVTQRNNVGLFAMYGGDFETAIRESREILRIDPQFGKALLCIALAQLGEGKPEEAASTWRQLAGMGTRGASMAAMGLGDLDLYEGRIGDVLQALPAAIAADLENKDASEAALKQIVLAQAFQVRGTPAKAVAMARAALAGRSDEMVLLPAAEILLQDGSPVDALQLASKLSARFDPEPRAYAEIIQGLADLKRKDHQAAINKLRDAQKVSDTWLGRLALGRAYLEAGAFAEAETELDNCLKRRGEASAVFQDDEPSFRYLPAVYYYRARAREGLHSPAAADDYKAFLALKTHSESDPQVTDARQRLAKF